MAISFVNKGTSSPVASGNLSPTNPASLAVDDILLCLIGAHDNVVCTMPAGWTRVTGFGVNNTTAVRLDLFWKRVTSTSESGATVTVTHAAGDAAVAVIVAYRGCTTSTTPTESGATTSSAGANATITAPSITPSAANHMLVCVGAVGDDGANTVFSGTDPTMSERHDELTALGLDASINLCDGIRTASSASGARTCTNGRSAVNVGGSVFLIASAAGGDVTVGLTGVSATGAIGTLAVALAIGLSGLAATGAVGTHAPQNAVPITTVVATSAVGSVTASGGDATVALTGVSATGSVGSVASGSSPPLTGVSATSSVGTVGPGASVGVSGVSGTSAVGTVSPSTTLALSGVAASGSVGTVTRGTTVALSGVAATGAVGSVTPSGGDGPLTLAGTQGTGAAGSVSPSITIALSGVSATGAAGSFAPARTLSLTGQSATGAVGTVTVSAAPIVLFQAAYRLWVRVVGGARSIQPAAGRRTLSASVRRTSMGHSSQRHLSSASGVRTLGPATL